MNIFQLNIARCNLERGKFDLYITWENADSFDISATGYIFQGYAVVRINGKLYLNNQNSYAKI